MENIGFTRSARGYNPKQVDVTIDRLIDEIKQKDAQLAQYGEKFRKMSVRLDDLDKQHSAEYKLIADAMIVARQDAERVLELAREEAVRIESGARNDAENIVTGARDESRRIITTAENDAASIRRRICEEYTQTETDMNAIAQSAIHIKERLMKMFGFVEERVTQVSGDVRQLLEDAERRARASAADKSGEGDYAAPEGYGAAIRYEP